MKNIYQVIRRPVITEKSTALKQVENQVVFEIDRRASKQEVREAVERLFSVKVTAVRTSNMPAKPKRFGRIFGRRSGWKKAIVTLAPGEELDFFESAAVGEEAESEEDESGEENEGAVV